MPKIHCTETAVKRLPVPDAGKIDYRDDEARHLYLRVSRASRRWYHVASVAGRMIWTKLGTWPGTSVAMARKLCAELDGQDRTHAPRRDMTLGDMWERYWRTRVEGRLKTAKQYASMWRIYLEPYARARLSTLSREDVATMHRQWGRDHGETAANRAVELLRACLSWGVDMELIERNPARKVERFRERSRERFLSAGELRRLFVALDEIPERQCADLVRLLLYTGARKSNVCAMAWANIDLDAGLWTVPGEVTKNGDPLRLPLVDAAMEILTRRKAGAGRNPWVFPGRSQSGHVVEPRKTWERIRERAGLEDVRLHDLRRTLGSWQAANGASLWLIGQSLGHRSQAATEVYARLDTDPIRASMNAAVEAMRGGG